MFFATINVVVRRIFMKITILGTGNATVTKCYNTCFTLSENDRHFLIDAGGGNGILKILEDQKIALSSIHDVFVSHGHTDHLLGVIWVVRMIGQAINQGKYEGDLSVYCHQELKEQLIMICEMMLVKKVTKLFGERIHFITVEDGQSLEILGQQVRVFDILSTKMKQYGFVMTYDNGKKLTFAGDEPLNEQLFDLAQGSDWMMHEAFCLYSQRERFKPYEKHHSTAKDACELAEKLQIRNLILYHTEEKNLARRKELYGAEGRQYYHGDLQVPDDGEVFWI